jgi:hypothetical protein
MAEDPLARIQSHSGIAKTEGETLREYVARVGEENDVDSALIDGALDYVTRWQYARTVPEDDGTFTRFLIKLGDEDADGDGVLTERDDEELTSAEPVVDDPDLEPVPELRPLRAERRETRSDFKGGLRGREPRTLLIRFLIIVVTAPVLGWMMGRAWVPGHQLYDQGYELLGAAVGIQEVAAVELAGMFGLGLYGALLALLLLDIKKRVQGVLLTLGSLLMLGAMATMGVFLPNLDFGAPLNLLGLGLGLAVGLLVEADRLLAVDLDASTFQRPTLEDGGVPEFRFAVLSLFGVVCLVVVVSLAQALLAGVARAVDVLAAGAFLAIGYQFIQYESETSYVTLGPARAGKSMLLLGLCLELIRADGPHPNPNEYLTNGIERVSNLQPGDERWPIPSTPPDDLKVASFEVIAGYYFPRRLQLSALDYAGQHLERVAELIADETAGEGEGDSVPASVADWITDSDTLIVILDVERLVYPEKFQEAGVTDADNISWGLEHYAAIIDHLDPSDVVVVATKCDILIDHGRVDPPTVADSYDEFREAVTAELGTRPDVTELLDLAGENTIHPTYFATKRSDREYVPRLDGDGNIMPVGFGHLIAEFRRRQ